MRFMTNDKIQRVTRTKAEAQATYDRISRWYTLMEGIWEKGARDLGLSKLAAEAGETVLEIGFGPGQDLLTLAKAVGCDGKTFGIDLASQMVRATQAKAAKAGLANQLALTRGDAVYLPFKDVAFDAIFLSFTLELFDTPDIPEVLAQCRRVLRRADGRICVVSLSRVGPPNRMRQLYEWGHERFPNLLDCRPIFVQAALEKAGFQTIDVALTSVYGLPVEIVLGRTAGGYKEKQ
jgi:demethylmenaquinone methyltransferase/2-methoxy-6-polyprenyl-1,4-benzoquinol methylase